MEEHIAIRRFQDEDERAVVGVWFRSGKAAYTFLSSWQALTIEQAEAVFREIIRPRCDIWVGTRDARIVAYLAIIGSYIDRLYVDPTEWRNGWGSRFISFEKRICPDGLDLCTHQENDPARAFYEKHGFKAVRFGISPPPECPPDVEYHWRPNMRPHEREIVSDMPGKSKT